MDVYIKEFNLESNNTKLNFTHQNDTDFDFKKSTLVEIGRTGIRGTTLQSGKSGNYCNIGMNQ